MPCDCSHLEPSYDEIQSKKVCKLICFLFEKTGDEIKDWIKDAADDYYGNPTRLLAAESILYNKVVNLNEDELDLYVYNGRSKTSRMLADWYEDYSEKCSDKIKRDLMIKEREEKAKSLLAGMRAEELAILRGYFRDEKSM